MFSRQEQKELALWAAACAIHVFRYFETERPRDNRPRTAIKVLRAWVRGKTRITFLEIRAAALAAHAAARACKTDSARYAARAAGQAAATAHVATHAPGAAYYALKSIASASSSKEHALHLRLLSPHLRSKVFPK